MANYLTVDGGTTNTRLTLVQNGQVTDTVSFSEGSNSPESPARLQTVLREGIRTLLASHGLEESDITCVLASGMITGDFGLCRLPHITAPAGVQELHETMHRTVLPEVSAIPFAFIRGVKTAEEDLEHVDMMRGEETELIGLAAEDEALYVLPGSHSKIVQLDKTGRIRQFKTMLTGEMLAALSQHTILRDSVDLETAELCESFLMEGYRYATRHGLNEALFRVRLLKNRLHKSPDEVYSFFLGTVLCDEIRYILSLSASRIVISGQPQLAEAETILLKACSDAEVITVPEERARHATTYGAVRIYEMK